MNRFVPIALGVFLFAACGAPEAKEAPTNTSLETITGFYHPEDLEVLPGGNLLLVSEYGGLNGERPATGRSVIGPGLANMQVRMGRITIWIIAAFAGTIA